ncbi:MAG: hypothetical protein ACREMR_03810 [Gemmatimonadales bacterium]
MAKPMTVEELTADVERALGQRLVTFLLYGSAARGEELPGRSDVNTLLICDRMDDALFDALEPAVSRWARQGQPGPLIFTRAEWRESADAFPIEHDEIRHTHRLLAGRDLWEGEHTSAARRDDLRRQLEHELRGKVVHLRQAYAAFRGDGARMAGIVRATAGGFLTMLRAALRLAGREVPGGWGWAEVVRAGGATMGFGAEPVVQLLTGLRGEAGRGGRGGRGGLAPRDPAAAAYLAAITRTAEFVNRLPVTRD